MKKNPLYILLISALCVLPSAFGQTTQPYTVELPAAEAQRLGLLPERVQVGAARLGEALGFELYWCLMNVPSDGFEGAVADIPCLTINDSYGLHPQIKEGKAINGGTPIGADIDAHRRKLARDLKRVGAMARVLPRDMLVAMDYESWPATLPAEDDARYAPYRELALEQIRDRYPDLEEACVVAVAEKEWQRKAAEFFEASIDVAKATRPELRWGFYYPQARHYWSGAYSGDLGDQRRAANDVLAATWAKVDWFPVSVYWFYPTGEGEGYGTEANNRQYVRDNVTEFVRLAGGPDDPRPVLPMIEPGIHHSNSTFKGEPIPDADLDLILAESHAAGAAGLMVWGWVSPGDAEYEAKVEAVQTKARPIAGAYVRSLREIADSEMSDGAK